MSADSIIELELDYEAEVAPPELAWLGDNPFGAMLELVLHATERARPGASLEALGFVEPLRLHGARRCLAQVERDSGEVRFTSWDPRGGRATLHFVARLIEASTSPLLAAARSTAPRAEPRVLLVRDQRMRSWIAPRALALIDAAERGEAVRSIARISVEASRWTAQLKPDAPWDAHYAVHPVVLEEVWSLACAFWASRGLPGARPLKARELRVLPRREPIESIELHELPGMGLRVELHTRGGIALLLDGVLCDAAAAVAKDAPAIERLAKRDLRAELARRPRTEHAAWCEAVIAEVLAELLHAPASGLALGLAFRDLGLPSIDAIRVSVALCHAFGWPPESTLLFDHPSIEQLAKHCVAIELAPTRARPQRALPESPAPLDAKRTPIAIVGIGCRAPGGVTDVDGFLRFLRDGRDAVGPINAARQALMPDFRGGSWSLATLDGIEQFDAPFFAMSEAEAITTSPQQRLLLEVTWQALEHAGIVPSTLRDSATSVFVAGSLPEYASISEARDAYFVTGNAPSALSGRISYALGLTGASVSVDTACSSSAVALCLACDDLRAGTSDLAIAGGANLVLDPRVLDGLSAASVLSEQGRCAAFDESADGYVRGEACCVVLLRRLDDAQRRGERVLAVVREYGVGHGGHSAGLAAPRREAIVDLIEAVLRRAALDARAVDYIEAHGTGTRVGDAIELEVLAQTYGAGRPHDAPVWIGSAKTNLGHTESASGLVGLIKAVIALQNGQIFPHLHFENPSASFDWSRGGLSVPRTLMPWPSRAPSPRIAAVNSFGISGTYAHVIVEEAPPSAENDSTDTSLTEPLLVPLSARSARSLRGLASGYAAYLREGRSAAALAKTVARHRELLPQRRAVVGASGSALAARLDVIAQEEPSVTGRPDRTPVVAFLFPGQGIQAAGVGRELYASQQVFRDAFDECAALSRAAGGPALHELMHRPEASRVLATDRAQPLIFSIELAMTRLLQSWGVTPRFVLGHSLGEYVAACVAGAFDVATALELVIDRGRLMQERAMPGAMVGLEAPEPELARLLAEHPRLEIASFNAPTHHTLAGAAVDIAALVTAATRRGLKARAIDVDQAFHSRAMDPLLDAFEQRVARAAVREVSDRLVSNLSGRMAGPELCSPTYWREHVRKPVRLMDGIRTLVARGADVFVEVGPRSSLLAPAARCTDADCQWIPTLHRKARTSEPELEQMLGAAAKLFELGAPVDLEAVVSASADVRRARVADVPLYAFDHRRCWPASSLPSAPLRGPSLEYELSWMPKSEPRALPEPRTWLLAAEPGPLASRLADALRQLGGGRVARTPFDGSDYPLDANTECTAVCLLERPRGHDEIDAVVRSAARVAEWVRAAQRSGARLRLAFITLGAQQSVGEEVDAYASALASFCRAIALEHPASWHGLFDLPQRPTASDVNALCAALRADDGEDQCAIRHGRRLVARIVHASEAADRGAFAVRSDAVYCITGGFGHLGLLTARWLIESGARHLCLIARGGAFDARRVSALQDLRAAGAHVAVAAVDVSDARALEQALRNLERPIGAVFHAAGVPGDAAIEALTEAEIGRVVRGKAQGARVICALMEELGIEQLVLFSSFAAVLCGREQAAYAAANGYLNAVSSLERLRGHRVQSILWGPWAGGGMAQGVGSATWAAGGLHPLQTRVGFAALQRLLAAGIDQRIVLDVDWPSLRELFEAIGRFPIFGELGAPSPTAPQDSEHARMLLRLRGEERIAALQAFLCAEIASVAGNREVWHEAQADIFDVVGLDSLALVQLRGRIRAALGLRIDSALFVEHRSVVALAQALDSLLVRDSLQPVEP